jgi:predicted nuclease with TOPRIM domain
MPTTGDREMQERLERVEMKVDRLETRFDSLERRFDGLELRFDGLETRFDGLETRFDGLEARFDGLEARLGAKIDVQMEEVRDLVKKTAEGFGARVDGMVREFKESQKHFYAKLADHDLALHDHTRRIIALESSSPQE